MLTPLQIVVSLFVASVIAAIVKTVWRWSRLPPGPWGYPYFGSLFMMPRFGQMPRYFTQLSKKYGDVFYLNLGMNETIVLNSVEAIQHCFKRPDCQDGTNTFTLSVEKEVGSSRLFAANGELWNFNRRIANKAIGMLSTTKNSRLEMNAQKGSQWLLDTWREKAKLGKPFRDRSDLKTVTCAVQGSLVFGGDPSPNNEFVKMITKYQDEADFSGILNSFLEFFPRLRFLYKGRIAKQKVIVEAVVKSLLKEYERVRHDMTGGIRIMDALEKAIKETPQSVKDANHIVDDDIRLMVMDLYDGGCFSLANKLEWAMLFMGMWPEACKPMWEEMDSAFTDDRLPEVADLDACPYTLAFLSEAMRYSSSTATAMTHSVGNTFYYKGFMFPKGTVIWGNIMAAHFDPRVFPDPHRFNPNRFLDRDGQYNMEAREKSLSFGYGKRRCPGEIVAYPIMFIYLASIAKNFRVELVKDEGIDPLNDTEATFLLSPGDHRVILHPRYVA